VLNLVLVVDLTCLHKTLVASNRLPQESYEDKLDPQQEPSSTPEVSPEVPEVSPEAPANEPVATKPSTLEELTNANPQ